MNNCSPSHATVDEAADELECFPGFAWLLCTSDSQSNFPVCRSKHRTDWDCFTGSDVARKIRFPTTVGEPCPRPGTGAFHKTPSVSLHRTGGFCPGAAIPSRVGPRQPGQSTLLIEPAAVKATHPQPKTIEKTLDFITLTPKTLANPGKRGKQ